MIEFEYKNHRDEIETRTVEPISLDYLNEPGYGYSPGWFLTAKDFSRGRDGSETRSFALSNIIADVQAGTPTVAIRIKLGE